MAVLKKHFTPLTKRGSVTVHKGKGSLQAPMPDRNQVASLANGPMNSINDYGKATPMPQPDAMPDMEGGLG